MRTRRALALIRISVALLITGYGLYLGITYEDRVIFEGAGYGFTIGQDKSSAFSAARSRFRGKVVYILWPLDEKQFGPHQPIQFLDEDFGLVADRDTWDFYLDTGYRNLVRLTFCDGKLCSVYRHRQEFELP